MQFTTASPSTEKPSDELPVLHQVVQTLDPLVESQVHFGGENTGAVDVEDTIITKEQLRLVDTIKVWIQKNAPEFLEQVNLYFFHKRDRS